MQIIYLDQNKWIDLARAVKYPADNVEVRAVLELLCAEAQAGRIALPLTATNIYETHKINNPERRFDLAYTQATLSAGRVFRGRHKRLETEIIDILRSSYGLPLWDREGDWFLSNVFFEATAEAGDPRLGQVVTDKVVELMRRDPPRALFSFLMDTPEEIRMEGVANFSKGSHALRQNIEEHRRRHAAEPLSMRRNIQNVLLTLGEQELILALAAKAGIPAKRPDELLRENARKIMNDSPTYYIEREIALKLEAQHNRPIEENDLRDMQTFCAVVRYADVVIAENTFANIARQAGLDKKFNTRIATSLMDLKDHLA